ncbi:MAG: hypothetical protein J5582_13790 [Ruminococcus sp.]|uniref:hypothetical protein n=1 Tax=Ruminococcus sp. TaxID=41978 RepID=UPI0025F6D695|nr:hypothetical protein [Ruminococcus sp.]MBO4867609.1 hypothetical protein [Ruminococcus sp.]
MLDFDKVLLSFYQLSGCRNDKTAEVEKLVAEALKAVEDSLDVDRVSWDDVPACEYAAACMAVYDYVCREACREQNAVTIAGSADINGDFSHRIDAAAELKKQAMARIEWLMPGGGFMFETM